MDHVVPGQGVDFAAVGHVLLLVLAVYVAASLLGWLQGYLLNDVVQGTVCRMRADVEDKVNRLPLSYFDQQPRGELLSRVTNDIDNVSQTLQQTMSQLLTSLLTVVAVLVDDVLDLAGCWRWSRWSRCRSRCSSPAQIMKRSQGMFIDQWRRTGQLNAHIEETFSGHALVKVFGRQAGGRADLRRGERRALRGVVRRAVRERADHADDDVHREPQLRRDRRPRRAPGRQRVDVAGRRAGVHPVLPPVHPAADPGRLDDEPAAVRASPRAERVFELLDADGAGRRRRPARRLPEGDRHGEVRFEHVSFSLRPDDRR